MKLPAIRGVIRRRILANYRVDPGVLQRQLPAPFRPKLLKGEWGVAGICLIRLEAIRPRFLPIPVGLSSENAAHRVAVCWTDANGEEREGVYIPRRDSDSRLNHLVGGRLFPGEHHRARFAVADRDGHFDLETRSADGETVVRVRAREADALPVGSRFDSLAEASAFFEAGSEGYSATSDPGRLDGLRLFTKAWEVRPLVVEEVASSYFDDQARFPAGRIAFDCALLMRDIQHEWRSLPDLVTAGADAGGPAPAGSRR